MVRTGRAEAVSDDAAVRVVTKSDPDGDAVEAIMWVDPADLPGNPMLRAELAADLDVVMAALGQAPDGGTAPKESVNYRPSQDPARCCGTCSMIRTAPDGYTCTLVEGAIDPGAVCDEWDPAGEGAVAKAAGAPPKGDPADWAGIWGRTYDRRQRLLAEHERAALAAWNDLAGSLSPRALVRQFRADIGQVAKLADPQRPWRKDRGRDAALAWLGTLQQKKGWAALVAALAAAIRDGMAEGEADSLAVAADRQGVKGFSVAAAFTAAADALQGSPDVNRKAQETAQAILAATAAAVAVTLADGAENDASDDETAAAVSDTVTGPDVKPVRHGLADALWTAAGAGLMGLIGRLFGGGTSAPAAPPEAGPVAPPAPPLEPPPIPIALISWVCEGGNPCSACLDNQGGSPYLPQDVPPYLAHNHCKCALYLASNVPSSFFAAYLLN